MSEHGECPECSRPLRKDTESCACGWTPTPEHANGLRCGVCERSTRFINLTPGEDGIHRCASCHIVYLTLRAAKSDDDHCTEPVCTRTVGEHRAELRRLLGILESRVMTKTAEMVRL